MAEEVFAFVVDVHVHRPSDRTRRTVFGWTIHQGNTPHEKMFHDVRGLPKCTSSAGYWQNDGYRAWVWFRGRPSDGRWRLVRHASNEHAQTAKDILENGWHLD